VLALPAWLRVPPMFVVGAPVPPMTAMAISPYSTVAPD
jgi:hypothetical protein